MTYEWQRKEGEAASEYLAAALGITPCEDIEALRSKYEWAKMKARHEMERDYVESLIEDKKGKTLLGFLARVFRRGKR